MNKRNYNPLSEGYTGGKVKNKGDYSSKHLSSHAPSKLPPIKSAVIKHTVWAIKILDINNKTI